MNVSNFRRTAEENSKKWDGFRMRREVAIDNYIAAKGMQMKAFIYVRQMKLLEAAKIVWAAYQNNKNERDI